MRPQDYADGEYTVEVIARDNVQGQSGAPDSRHATTRSFPVTVDRRGDIYSATQHLGNPAQAGTAASRDWGRIGTSIGRSESRIEVATRDVVPCNPDAPDGAKCAEHRQRPYREDGQELMAAVSTYRSEDPDDKRLDRPSETVDISRQEHGTVDAQGPITSVALPSQTLPPAHGSTYLRYDEVGTEELQQQDGGTQAPPSDTDEPDGAEPASQEVQVTVQLFVDERTRLPLRERAVTSSGSERNLYWNYAIKRLLTTEVPADFFRMGRPGTPEAEENISYTGQKGTGPTRDSATGRSYMPRSLGPVLSIGPTAYCLASGILYDRFEKVNPAEEDFDPDGTQRDLSWLTQAHAEYSEVASGGSCTPGIGSLDDPHLEVLSYHRDSPVAADLREQVQAVARATQADPTYGNFARGGLQPALIELQPTTVYLLPLEAGRNSILFDIGETTVQILGRFEKSDVNTLLAELEAF